MTILVTGGAGFIGSHLTAKLLEAGHSVRILDTLSAQIHGEVPENTEWLRETPNLEFMRGSVADREALAKAIDGVEAIVHLASETGTGQSMYEISRYCHENVQGTAELCQMLAATKGHGVKRVLLSSSRSVYGEGAYLRPSDQARVTPAPRTAAALKARQWEPVCAQTGEALQLVPTREDDRTAPSSIYAATKLMQEDLLRITCDSMGIGYGILRLQNVYGEGQSLKNPYTGILSIFSTKIRRGLELPIYEDGLESRDFVHVSDVVAGFVKALGTPEPVNTIVNVGYGQATSVLDVAASLSRAFGAEPNTRVTGEYRLGDIRHNAADVTRLETLLGHTPEVDLDTGLSRFAAWVGTQALPEDQLEKAKAELVQKGLMG
ncbi:NAD-dependent epimerase/dehydratase family protein [Rhodobacter sp. NTK016B]|uniref:NAD-dependent epimerase/dehydratase family protein n=1 Tax=Rhodobacter sp. NTK016B TaxID=2759676 RepID=UPI001A8D2284|nr:NAD-dependent epimerase/dehydratase family protein [Rhodobacter sp. NTK016B]MBN8291124.1 NAD-dependent epimerase/dehydratase family protein [Rhodobacter sp. NTK016B]